MLTNHNLQDGGPKIPVFFIAPLLRDNLHTIKSTLLKYVMQLVDSMFVEFATVTAT